MTQKEWTDTDKKRLKALLIAEGTSYFSAPGGLIICDRLFPGSMKRVEGWIKRNLVMPNLDTLEKLMAGHLKATDKNGPPKTRDQHASVLADDILRLAVSTAIGGGGSMIHQRYLENKWQVKTDQKVLWGSRVIDGTAHIGAMIAMPTLFSAVSKWLSKTISEFFQTFVRFDKRTADNIGFSAVYTVIPEICGTLAGASSMLFFAGRGNGISPGR